MPQIPIFVINLDESKDRWKKISSSLDALGLYYERFSAVRGVALSQEELNQYCPNRYLWWTRNEISLGAIGCYLSHLKLYEEILRRDLEVVCVIEDDATLSESLPEWLERAHELIDQSDILKLTINGDYSEHKGIHIENFLNRKIAFLPSNGIHGTYGYIISKSAIKKIIDRIQVVHDAIDHTLFEYWNTNLRILHVYPPVITHESEESIIELETVRKGRNKYPKSTIYRLRRRVRDVQKFYRQQTYMFMNFGIKYPFKLVSLSQK